MTRILYNKQCHAARDRLLLHHDVSAEEIAWAVFESRSREAISLVDLPAIKATLEDSVLPDGEPVSHELWRLHLLNERYYNGYKRAPKNAHEFGRCTSFGAGRPSCGIFRATAGTPDFKCHERSTAKAAGILMASRKRMQLARKDGSIMSDESRQLITEAFNALAEECSPQAQEALRAAREIELKRCTPPTNGSL